MKHTDAINIVFLCIGCIIGWGAFVLPQDLFLSDIGLLNALIGVLLGALIMCIIAHNYSFLITTFPQNGGEFIFALRTLGKIHGFICGWFLSLAYLCIIPLNATALSILLDSAGLKFLHMNAMYEVAGISVYVGDVTISCVSIIAIALVNLAGLKAAFKLQKLLVVALVGGVIFFTLSMSLDSSLYANFASYITHKNIDINAILRIIAISPWLYIGFDCAVQVIRDVNCSKHAFQILVYISIIIGATLYCATMVIVALGLPHSELQSHSFAIGISIEQHFGKIGLVVILLGIVGAIASGINGFFIATDKVISAMVQHQILPVELSKQNCFGANQRIIIFIGIIACVCPFFGRKSLLYVVDMSSIGIIIAFLYMGIVSVVLKRRIGKTSIMAILCVLLSLLFLTLLFAPFSPCALKIPSIIALFVWCVLGVWLYSTTCAKIKTFI